MSDAIPTVFNGRYEIHRTLGRGGMAEVHLARDQLLDRPVAVKVLFAEHANDPSFVERFRREAQAAANLNHPNIVSVYDWGQSDSTYFIVMEYVDGRSLSDILSAEGPLHPDRVADVGADVAAALGFAHRNGVVHRDVKPGNVLVTQTGQVKVADFGIARAIESTEENLTQAGTVMGTATYFSPEQARGAAVDPRSDIYSLGCVLYELVLGRPPFSGDSPVAIAYKHVQETPEPPRQVDPELSEAMEAIILKCLAKNPVNRYPSAEDLRADLRRFRDGMHVLAEPVMTPPVDPGATGVMAATTTVPAYAEIDEEGEEEPKKRRRWWLWALLALALLGLLLFFLLRDGDDDPTTPPVAEVDVPNVVGQPEAEARAQLEDLNLEVEVERAPNNDQPEGVVFGLRPPQGTTVEEGSTVTIQVSQGAATVPVPEVVGLTFAEAESRLAQDGFTVVRQDAADDDAPVNQVIAQNPGPGQEAPEGSAVTLTVSTGPAAREVPDVAGLTVAEASNRLGAAGFDVGSTAEEASESVPDGQVIRTDPAGGTVLAPGSRVNLVVSSGPADRPVPQVVGLSEANAIAQLQQAGFTPNVSEEDVTDEAEDGRVIEQSPEANTTAPPDSEVDIVIGRFVQSDEGPGGGGGGGG